MTSAADTEGATTFVQRCSVHFDDLDPFGMLYHGRYIPLVDRAFVALMSKMGFDCGHEDMIVAIREVALKFHEPIRQVGEVDVEFRISRVGRSSATFEFVVKSDHVAHASGHRCNIKFDPATGRSKPWTDEVLEAFHVRRDHTTTATSTPQMAG